MPDLLPRVLGRERLSLMHYAAQARPWADARWREAAGSLRAAAAAEADALDRLADAARRRRLGPPTAAAFPTDFTRYNDVSAAMLLPLVAAEQAGALKQLEADAASAEDADRDALAELLSLKQRHAEEMSRWPSS